MPDPNAVTVTIYGREYTLLSDDDPAYLAELARCVDDKMREAAGGGTETSALKAAVLAALNLADELTRARGACRDDRLRADKILRQLAEEVGMARAEGV